MIALAIYLVPSAGIAAFLTTHSALRRVRKRRLLRQREAILLKRIDNAAKFSAIEALWDRNGALAREAYWQDFHTWENQWIPADPEDAEAES